MNPSSESFIQVLCPLITHGLSRKLLSGTPGRQQVSVTHPFQMWCIVGTTIVGTTIISLETLSQAMKCYMDVTKSLIFLPFDGKTYSWKGFGIGVLFIYKKEHGETCSPTGRPLYLSVNTRLQGSVFSSAEQPLNGHWKS